MTIQFQPRFFYGLRRSLLLLLSLWLGLGLSSSPAQAATLSVTNTNDSGAGSLRQVIADAPAGSTVNFNLTGCPCTITLTSGELVINKNLTITGLGAKLLTISGNNTSRIFRIAAGTFTVIISDLTVANGSSSGAGGAIRVESNGAFTLRNAAVMNSKLTATSGAGGGLEFRSSAGGGDLTIERSIFSGNSAPEGGAIHLQSGNVIIRNTTISGNTATGPRGGGIANYQSNLTILNSTITGNSAVKTGTEESSGGVNNPNTANITVANSILAGNSGSNPDVGDYAGATGTFISLGNNLIGSNQGAATYFPVGTPNAKGDLVGTSAVPLNPLLAPLADNGGSTLTHALQAGSPALNAGNAAAPGGASPACELTDQRGSTRPNRCDIGAFEVIGTPVDVTPPTANPTHSPPPAPSGWNNTNVTVSWNWSDNVGGRGIDAANCTTSSVSSGSATVTLTATCKDLAGNVGSATYQARVDPTAPTANPSPSPAANAAGWNNSDVTVNWNWTFTGAIIDTANCTTSSVSSGEGALTLSATCKDVALNQRTATYAVKVDKRAPLLTGNRTPAANANGWHNSAVTVSFTCQEQASASTSGVVTNTVAGATVSTEGANQAVTNTGICVDAAGNGAAPVTVSPINIDLTKPTISAAVTTQPNSNGWYNRDVNVRFTCADALAGIATCPSDEILSSEGTALTSTAQTSNDKAQNISEPSNVITVKIDKTAPVVVLTGVTAGASYAQGSEPAVTCSTTDGLSGVATSATLSITGGNGDGTGNLTATCSGATDLAGNSAAPVSVGYTIASSLAWPITTLDSVGDIGQFTALALDSGGNPVISYFDNTNGDLKLVYCASPTCDSGNLVWTIESVGNVGGYTSLVLDSSGNPVISYYDATNGDLKLVRCGNNVCTSGNTIQTVDSAGNVGGYTALALDSSGNPVISYHDVTNGDLKLAHCGDPACTSGNTIQTVDTANNVGRDASLALDRSGNPVISYVDVTNYDLKLVHCGNPACSSGNVIRILDSAGVVGTDTSLALDSVGNPVVSYFDVTNHDLKLVHCGDPTCGSGNVIQTVDSAGWVGEATSLELDSNGNPVISYYDTTNSDLKLVRCGNATCSSGNTFRTVDSAGDVGWYTSLVLDSSGYPAISYYDVTNRDLKLVHVVDATLPTATPRALPPTPTITPTYTPAPTNTPAIPTATPTTTPTATPTATPTYAPGLVWQFKTLDSAGSVGQYTSLMLSSSGNPVISYYDATNGDLKLLRCGNATCGSSNTIQTVDSTGLVGQHTSLALDSSGNPVISYLGANSDLKLVHCDYPTCGSGNSLQSLDSTSFVGLYISLAVDSSGNPVISYYDSTNGALKLVRCGNAICSNGNTIQTVDKLYDAGLYTSLVLDSSSNPVISYYEATNGDLKLVYCGNPTCSSGNTFQTVDSAGDVGQYTDLALDSSGNPVISYYDRTNGDLKLVKCGNATCSSGNTIRTLDSTGLVGQYTSLALKSNGNPVISYYDVTNHDLKLVQCGNATCTVVTTIQTVDSVNAVGQYTSLALDSSGTPLISYYDQTNGDLKLAHMLDRTLPTATPIPLPPTPTVTPTAPPTATPTPAPVLNWQIKTLDSTGAVGQYTSLALNSNGNPLISYYDVTNGDLRLFYCGNATCSSGNTAWPVDRAGDVGQYTSLVLNSSGNPVISYYDVTNRDLKLAYCNDSTCSNGNTIQTIDSAGDVGQYTSLALSSNGNPIISYYDATNRDLKLVRCGNPTCSSGNTIQTIENTGDVGQYTSLALNSSGNPVISYQDSTNGNGYIDLHFCTNPTCTTNNWAGFKDNEAIGWYTSLALDSSDTPVISFLNRPKPVWILGTTTQHTPNKSLEVLYCGDPICSSGNSLYTLDTMADDAQYTSLVLDGNGRPVVSYRANNTLRLVRCGNATCRSGNVVQTVDSTAGVGEYSSLTLDRSGNPVISYYDSANGDLKLAQVVDPALPTATPLPLPTLTVPRLAAWGDNRAGVISLPEGVQGRAIASGSYHSLVLKADGTVVAWGCGGNYNYGQCTTPTGLKDVKAIGAGELHSLALKVDGTVVAWGCATANFGQCTVPLTLTQVISITGGFAHSLALRSDGTVVAWGCGGSNNLGQCTIPTGLSGVTAIGAGHFHSLALKGDGTVIAWGGNNADALNVPAGLNSVGAIAAGPFHNLALKRDGTVVAWGCGAQFNYGQCTVPAGLNGVVAIAAGAYHSLALKNDGTVVSWGCAGSGNVGQCTVPTWLRSVTAISTGGLHSVVLTKLLLAVGTAAGDASASGASAGGAVVAAAANTVVSTQPLTSTPLSEGLAITPSLPVSAPVSAPAVVTPDATPALSDPSVQTHRLFLPLVTNMAPAIATASAAVIDTQSTDVLALAVTTATLPVAELGAVTPTQPLSAVEAAAPVTVSVPVTVATDPIVTASVPVSAQAVVTSPVLSATIPVTAAQPVTTSVVDAAAGDGNPPASPDTSEQTQQLFLPIITNVSALAGAALGNSSGIALLALVVLVVGGLIWRRRSRTRR